MNLFTYISLYYVFLLEYHRFRLATYYRQTLLKSIVSRVSGCNIYIAHSCCYRSSSSDKQTHIWPFNPPLSTQGHVDECFVHLLRWCKWINTLPERSSACQWTMCLFVLMLTCHVFLPSLPFVCVIIGYPSSGSWKRLYHLCWSSRSFICVETSWIRMKRHGKSSFWELNQSLLELDASINRSK